MNNLNTYIIEKLKKINSKNTGKTYNYFPKDKKELKQIIEDIIKERGLKADLNDIDTSKIKDMSFVFTNSTFNGDISEWDVSNVKNMSYMFANSKFTRENGDISNWDVSNVEDMIYMFTNSKFNGNISEWNVSNVKYMNNIFRSCPLEKNPPIWYKN